MTKIFWIPILILLTSFQIYSQSSNQISAYYGLLDSELIRFTSSDGAGGYSNSNSYELGLKYSKAISNKLSLEIGMNLFHADVAISFNDPDTEDKQETIDLISIPITANLELKNNFFFSSGISIDIQNEDQSYDRQSGIGLSIGVGKRIYMNDFYFNINPLISIHSLLPFHKESQHQRLLKAGLLLGIGYQF